MKKIIILRKIQFEPEQEKSRGNESYEKENKHIHAIATDLLHIKIGNLDWCKCRHCKNEAREIDCVCCREMYTMLIASAKIPEHEGSI